MQKYEYMAAMGGPHLVLPDGLRAAWKGVPMSVLLGGNPLDPKTDYGRACAAAGPSGSVALISVADGRALVLGEPPLSAWARTREGVDLFVLLSWTMTECDALIDRAIAATPDNAMTDLGLEWQIDDTGLTLLAATDVPGDAPNGENRMKFSPGRYAISRALYKKGGDEVIIFRVKRKTQATSLPAADRKD